MADRSIGFIETFGLAACVAAADAAVKSANVKLLGFEYAKGDGMCTVKVEGNVGACKAAIAAGKRAAEMVNGSLSGTKSVLLKARPADGMRELLVDNRETVGGEIALAEGYRPAGDTKKPVLVKNWKPKEEPKAETPAEVTPEPPVVEGLAEETSDAEKKTDLEDKAEEPEPEPEPEIQPEPQPEPEPEAEPQPEPEPVVEPEPEVTESVEAPEAEEPVSVEAPEEVPVEEKPEEEPAQPAPEVTEAPAETADSKEADAPKRKTSTGRRRSRKKKPTSDN